MCLAAPKNSRRGLSHQECDGRHKQEGQRHCEVAQHQRDIRQSHENEISLRVYFKDHSYFAAMTAVRYIKMPQKK